MAEVTREEVEQLSEKVEAFALGLSEREQDILATVFMRAGDGIEEPEVSGYSYPSGTQYQLSRVTYATEIRPGVGSYYFPRPGTSPIQSVAWPSKSVG